jgi:hypothetical protein
VKLYKLQKGNDKFSFVIYISAKFVGEESFKKILKILVKSKLEEAGSSSIKRNKIGQQFTRESQGKRQSRIFLESGQTSKTVL